MKIIRNGQEWELTPAELREAFEEQRKEYLKEDAVSQLCFHALEGDSEGIDEAAMGAFKRRYGIDFSELLNEDSKFYMVKRIMEKFEKNSSCNEAENITYETIVEELLRELGTTQSQKRLPQSITLKDPSVIGQFEMWGKEEWCVEGEGSEAYLNFYIPVTFDANKAFGLNIQAAETDDYINVYLNWYPQTDSVELIVCYVAPDADKAYEVVLTDDQKEELKRILPEICNAAYGSTNRELWEKAVQEKMI